ncbi:hypothetical protein Cgig2_034173 [Carnegiea gigantea]|uniref:Zinc finger GRF-type domain-containing protein n=1 Tax=Carnegiea gigantea TaxID=171969 RepID=A0A9Q1Q794_9CARY|nr:hypothetical protein Cgig2_034173 [Carnegiea gigantea]
MIGRSWRTQRFAAGTSGVTATAAAAAKIRNERRKRQRKREGRKRYAARKGLIMEGSSSSRSKLASEDIVVCRRCNCEGVRNVSHSSQNPGRLYFKYLRCDKFLKWAANEGPQERPVVVDVDIVKKELIEMRLMLKFIEKGQTLIVILLIVVIVLIATVVVI